jgi:hypothetical protein
MRVALQRHHERGRLHVSREHGSLARRRARVTAH